MASKRPRRSSLSPQFAMMIRNELNSLVRRHKAQRKRARRSAAVGDAPRLDMRRSTGTLVRHGEALALYINLLLK